jgi:putative N6-adenine-specific DNA methylase
LKEENIFNLYKTIGDKLKKDFSGFDVWIFSANKEALKHIGLRTSRRLTLFNGPLETKFHKYEMYRGSKKASKRN